ncbi:phage tail tape measure protein [Buttiauxella sp. A111]|uniref:phage tail tape measure protein n=1 Tax=Buttiauxella sp. A111 TaxID=2563088 RepID=UPI0010D749B6|nr:phage tail tape measure protein [Buttiauxella sp. A111]GDX06630.1 phage tail tape measure protein [Buttiauxella sp. A111]
MADKKVSVLLSAKDAMSPAFTSADKSLNTMRKSAAEVGAALGNLKKQQGDAQAHLKTQQALKETNRQLSENKKRVDAAGQALREAQAEQRRYQKGIAGAEETLRNLDVELARNGKLTREQRVEHTRATQSLEQLRPAYKKASAEVAGKRREDNAATREMHSLTAAADKEKVRLQSLGSALKKTGVDTRNLAKEQTRLTADAGKASAALQKQERRIQTMNSARAKMEDNRATRASLKGQVLGTAVAAAPLVAMGKKAMDYEYAWSDVQKVVNFRDADEDRNFQLQVRNQAKNLGISQQGMTEIVAAGGQAGVANGADGKVDSKQLLKFSVDAAKLAVAFDTDAATAGDTMAKLRTSMKLDQNQVMKLADYINQTSNEMAAKPMEVAAIMRRMGANTKLSGFSNNQSAALAATLVASGETEETGATAMKNISGRLTAGFATTKSGRNGLSMLGFEPNQLARDMQKNAPATLIKVLEAVKKQSPEKQKAIISQIFGEEVSGAVAKLAGNVDLLKKAMTSAGNEAAYAGSMEQEYQKKTATRKARMDRMQSGLESLSISLGTLLLPVIDELEPPVSALADGLSNLLETSETAKSTFGWALKIGAGLVALKGVHIVAKGLISMFSDLKQLGRMGKAKLGGATDHTTISANRAAAALERMNRQMDRMGGGGKAAGSGDPSGGRKGKIGKKGKGGSRRPHSAGEVHTDSGRDTRRPVRSRGRGLAGAVMSYAVPFAATYGLDYLQGKFSDDDTSEPSSPGDASGTGKEVTNAPAARVQPAMAGMLPALSDDVNYLQTGAQLASPFIKGTGRMFTPLALAGGAINTASVVMNGGSAAEVGGAVGSTGGALAGAAVGAAIGTAILPGIGTAVGGAIGGLAGSELGQKMGEVVGPYIKEGWEGIKGWFSSDDSTSPASDKVAKVQPKDLAKVSDQTLTPAIDAAVELAKKSQPLPPPVYHIKVENSPHFDVKASGDPAQDNALAQKIKAILEQTQTKALHEALAQIGPDARLNASLSGQRSD